MSKFKVGDRVKILVGCHKDSLAIITTIATAMSGYLVSIELSDNKFCNGMFYQGHELGIINMPKFVEVKTKTVKKYAVVEVSNGSDYPLKTYYTEQEVAEMNQEQSVYENSHSYHIVPTLFTEEEVPVKTETRYTFICHTGYDYYVTSVKYKDLAEAKAATMTQALQQIDSSAEEFEIE